MKDGGAAFPILDRINDGNGGALVCIANGMTLRDYFAGQALIANVPFYTFEDMLDRPDRIAKCAYKIADAMLAEREKRDNDTTKD